MAEHPPSKPDREQQIAALVALVEALDRQVPHVERAGEMRIAQEAATLRKLAGERLEKLRRAAATRPPA